MTVGHQAVQPLPSPWESGLAELVCSAKESILVVSPYVGRFGARQLVESVRETGRERLPSLLFLTDLSTDSLAQGSVDARALLDLAAAFPRSEIRFLPGVHAKAYVADSTAAIVTSGNLTEAGLKRNYEYGVFLRGRALVAPIRRDLESYAALGAEVTSVRLESFAAASDDLRSLRVRLERSARKALHRRFRERADETELELLQTRAAGKTTHGIFSETVLYVLSRGPMRTEDIHPLVQRIHPDLCDDGVDRVIDDVHFGKKWKHYVRNAQQALKRQGRIRLRSGVWSLK